MKKRMPQDLCLLCHTRYAAKKNSHIFPKFWVKGILGSDNQREGYNVSSAAGKLGQKIQDSPKEDYILCTECEELFSVAERYVANSFYNLYKNPAALADFTIIENKVDELDNMLAAKVHPILFKLFIYSLVWRASISNHAIFSNFKLKAQDEENLRQVLNDYLHATEKATVDYWAENENAFKALPFNIVTTLDSSDATSNMIAPFDAEDGRILLFANEFIIIVYLDWSAPNHGSLIFNLGKQQRCVGILPLGKWQEYHAGMVDMLVEDIIKNREIE